VAEQQPQFDDGAAYERMMGVWSRLAGEIFLDWLAPASGLRWIDVGCGNGAFTELLVERCAPAEVQGIDSSIDQLAFAKTRPAARVARFQPGDAMALPFPDNSFDAAVMALVIFFVPDPAKGVAEMARVVCPGGMVTAYAWDTMNAGSPLAPINAEMRALNVPTPRPPAREASRIETLHELWAAAGLEDIETRTITVQRTFPDFDDFWTTTVAGTIVKPGDRRHDRRRQGIAQGAGARASFGGPCGPHHLCVSCQCSEGPQVAAQFAARAHGWRFDQRVLR
jgi:ubiquinone/menaquinone biosynthesis C-methylase UbiE